jgi:hypothetical protein
VAVPALVLPLELPELDAAPDDVDDELDELLPHAARATATMTESRTTANGLVCLFTDPPPQEGRNSQGRQSIANS